MSIHILSIDYCIQIIVCECAEESSAQQRRILVGQGLFYA